LARARVTSSSPAVVFVARFTFRKLVQGQYRRRRRPAETRVTDTVPVATHAKLAATAVSCALN